MFQMDDPWEKAAECDRALQATVDSTHRQIIANVRELWLELANAKFLLTGAEFAEQIEVINRIHAELIKRARMPVG